MNRIMVVDGIHVKPVKGIPDNQFYSITILNYERAS